MKKILLALLLLVLFIACSKENDHSDEILLTVASKKVMSKDWTGIQKERNVIREADGQWQILFGNLDGIQCEDGYEYLLKVRKIVPPKDVMDSYTSYELIELLSKEQKATIFESANYSLTNNAVATGSNLSQPDKAAIEASIKQSSPFNEISGIKMDFTNFYQPTDISRDCKYTTQTGKTGRCSMTKNGDVLSCTFEFDESEVSYIVEDDYLIKDLTSVYKANYPALESAKSGIKFNKIR